jgi:hypothetical protein
MILALNGKVLQYAELDLSGRIRVGIGRAFRGLALDQRNAG